MNTTAPLPPLSEAIDLLEQSEMTRRADDARRLRLLAGMLSRVHDEGGQGSQSLAEAEAEVDPQKTGTSAEPGSVGSVGSVSSVASPAPSALRGGARSRELAYRSLRAELAAALTLGERSVEHELAFAYTITSQFAATLTSLESGLISRQHAQVIVNEGDIVGISDNPVAVKRRAAYEAQVLEFAAVSTPGQLRPIARKVAEAWAEVSIDERHREARKRRSVTVVDAGDGMADLLAHLPLVDAVAIRERLVQIARTAERGQRIVRSADERAALVVAHAGGDDTFGSATGGVDTSQAVAEGVVDTNSESRTRDQLQADVLVEMLLSADPFELTAGSPAEAIQARVQLIAPAEFTTTNADADTESDVIVELAGYGPIDLNTARAVAARASHWEHTIVHADTGVVLAVDRYRPSEEIRRFLGARDVTCSFPGCVVPVHRCDFDHTIDAQFGGETSTENLSALCRGHHVLKHESSWEVKQLGSGTLRWISPTGREHMTKPPGQIPPRRHPILRAVAESREAALDGTRARSSRVQFKPAEPADTEEPAEPF